MQNTIFKDPRVIVAKKIITSIVAKSYLPYSEIMITGDNTLVIVVLETSLYSLKLDNLPLLPPIAFKFSDIENLNEDEYINNSQVYYKLNWYYNYYFVESVNRRERVVYEEDLRANQEFEYLLSRKASEGMKFFKIDNYIIPVFSGFPNINKSDRVGITIYDLKDGYLLNELNIFKKKINKDIKMYYRTLNHL